MKSPFSKFLDAMTARSKGASSKSEANSAPGSVGQARALIFRNNDFQLQLGGDWRQTPNLDPDQFNFVSEAKQTAVVISVVRANIPAERLIEAVTQLSDLRQRAESAAVPGRTVVFGDRWTEMKEPGELAHVAYAGYDNLGHIFRFFGWATLGKILSFWVSTETRDNDFAKKVFEEVFAGFKFTIP